MFLSVIYEFDVAKETKKEDLKFKAHPSKKEALFYALRQVDKYFQDNLKDASTDFILYAANMTGKINYFMKTYDVGIRVPLLHHFVCPEDGNGITFTIKEIKESGEIIDII